VTPITTATNKVGKPIKVASGAMAIAITPDGKTAYVVSWSDTVTPVNLATNTAGPPIHVGGLLTAIVFTPDSKTAYVSSTHGVIPISTATNKAGAPIGGIHSGADALVIAP
jgi:DNA-binding beta-propeller fold protein YncE